VIESRRTELEKWLRTVLRREETRDDFAVKCFLTRQSGLDECFVPEARYSWVHSALLSIDRNFTIDMLKAVAKSEFESRGSDAADPERLALAIPNAQSMKDFVQDLEDRLKMIEQIRDRFSAQAKIGEVEATHINLIGLSLQALSSIDFNDTFQVVMRRGASAE